MVQPEDDGYVIYLPPDASDDALGRALLEALDRSRFIWPPDEPEFLNPERYQRCYQNWQKDFMRRYGYKTKRDAYKNMDWCRAGRRGRFQSCHVSATSQSILEIFRRKGLWSFRRRGTRLLLARR